MLVTIINVIYMHLFSNWLTTVKDKIGLRLVEYFYSNSKILSSTVINQFENKCMYITLIIVPSIYIN